MARDLGERRVDAIAFEETSLTMAQGQFEAEAIIHKEAKRPTQHGGNLHDYFATLVCFPKCDS